MATSSFSWAESESDDDSESDSDSMAAWDLYGGLALAWPIEYDP